MYPQSTLGTKNDLIKGGLEMLYMMANEPCPNNLASLIKLWSKALENVPESAIKESFKIAQSNNNRFKICTTYQVIEASKQVKASKMNFKDFDEFQGQREIDGIHYPDEAYYTGANLPWICWTEKYRELLRKDNDKTINQSEAQELVKFLNSRIRPENCRTNENVIRGMAMVKETDSVHLADIYDRL